MFIKKYLDDIKCKLLFDVYDLDYIYSLDEENFCKIYNLFKMYDFYFIDDIVLNYLEIFEYDYNFVHNKLMSLIGKLGEKYTYIIGNDLRCLDVILEKNSN